jgi:hypothetical protein
LFSSICRTRKVCFPIPERSIVNNFRQSRPPKRLTLVTTRHIHRPMDKEDTYRWFIDWSVRIMSVVDWGIWWQYPLTVGGICEGRTVRNRMKQSTLFTLTRCCRICVWWSEQTTLYTASWCRRARVHKQRHHFILLVVATPRVIDFYYRKWFVHFNILHVVFLCLAVFSNLCSMHFDIFAAIEI